MQSPPIDSLSWGILGTGRIARTFAAALRVSNTGRLTAVGSRSQASADAFAQEYGVPRAYASYDDLLADPDVDAVYISLPNHLHARWTVRCAEAGKHILCEKPLATNYPEAMTALEAVRRHDVFLMEAFMYRCHPQTARLVELIRQNAIGQVRVIQTHFSYNLGGMQENIRLQSAAAGGGIMDVGCYCTSMARLIAGAAVGQDFADPLVTNDGYRNEMAVQGYAHIGGESRVDEWAVATVKFPGDIVATLTCGTQARVDSALRIWGSAGHIIAPNPWFPGEERFGGDEGAHILLYRDGQPQPEKIETPGGAPLYTIEADTVARHLQARQAPAPCMTWADSLGNMRTLDAWRRQIGLVFDVEQPGALAAPTVGRPLARRADHPMLYGRVEGVDKPISRLVMGTMIFKAGQLPLACSLLDYFFAIGGNCFDTAHVYRSEETLGQWLKLRNIREQMVIIGKGARDEAGTPQGLTRQLLETLEKLQTDYLDIYLMHSDNPVVPVGEFVECLNEHRRAGRIRAFGGSNWSVERLTAANAYARERGLTGFSASSPNLSLAAWNEPMWPGCLTASDGGSRRWYAENQMPLFAWSSQATGFFSGRYRPEDRDNPALAAIVRTWFNEDNFRRRERARELAAQKGATPNQIALAYVLCQPFPTFALIGPQTIDELRDSLPALGMALTPGEMRWLNLETSDRRLATG
ncbi:MAG: aldo/keto reductase [Chloroflexi bacterium]|nr:aldo/keto reductase [Chloroflexota bacterium]